MNGQEISKITTLKTMYDMDSIRVMVGKKEYRMKVNEVLSMVNEFKFNEVKKRKHTYLEVDDLIDGGN